MSSKSTYLHRIEIDLPIRTAIIYSVDHLYAYIIEIKDGKESFFISDKEEPCKFGNMEDARKAAIKEHAKQAFLALTKTSEETDLSTCHAGHHSRYSYTPIPLDID